MKILSVGVKLFLEDRQTDRHGKANNRFLQFYLGPKNGFKDKGYGNSVYIGMSQDRGQWRTYVNMQMKIRVP